MSCRTREDREAALINGAGKASEEWLVAKMRLRMQGIVHESNTERNAAKRLRKERRHPRAKKPRFACCVCDAYKADQPAGRVEIATYHELAPDYLERAKIPHEWIDT